MDQSLLAKYITGACNDAEQRAVDAWVQESSEHAAELERLQRLWEAAGSPGDYEPNTEKAWKSLEARIRSEASGTSGDSAKADVRPLWPRLLRVAAVAAILAIGGWVIFGSDASITSPDWTVYTSTDSVRTISLADGSVVTLNRNSRLEVSPGFEQDRQTRIKGEAFFEVAKQDGKRFEVDLGQSSIEVLGTKFNVKNSGAGELVSVEEGKVAFSKEQSATDSLHLSAGQSAGYVGMKIKRVPSPDPNFMAWRTGKVNFVNRSMAYVKKVLVSNYGQEIYLPEEIESCQITAKFNESSMEKIMQVIAVVLNTEAVKTENQWSLEGGNCE